jgi:serine/threonine protein phosphatase 1
MSWPLNFAPAPGVLAPGRRVYAIGDIHGCSERLGLVHRQIALDLRNRPADDVTLIHLGDYIDRGPDTAGVLSLLAREPAFPVDRVVNLMGNHEEMALQAIAFGDQRQAEAWLANGGTAALSSWGIPRTAPLQEWPELLPREHLRFMSRLSLQYRLDDYLFVHAGVRPGIPLTQLSRRDLLWIREPFLSSQEAFGAVVVHGHTPMADPVLRPNRIGIDTGAGRGGRLTCAVLEANKVAFFAA